MKNIDLRENLREHKEKVVVFVTVLLMALALGAVQAGAAPCDGKNCPGGGGGGSGDGTPPETTITSGPIAGAPTTATSAMFVFSSNEQGSTFKCQLSKDGAVTQAWADCMSPMSYSNLGPGDYRFDVRAKDSAGNVDQTPASLNWTITSSTDPQPPAALRYHSAQGR